MRILIILFSLLSTVYAENPKRILTSDIGSKVLLIGKSGLPLGEVFNVEAKIIVEKAKHDKESDSKYIIIRKINDQNFKKPIKIIIWRGEAIEATDWTKMQVIEDARYSLHFHPNQSMEDTSDEGRQVLNSGIVIIKILP